MSDETQAEAQAEVQTESVADTQTEKVADTQTKDSRYDFVLDKYRADGRSEDEALQLQAKSYKDLQSRFGSFTGAPDEYQAKLPDHYVEAGIDFLDDDPLIERAKEMAKGLNMNQDGFNEMVNMYAEIKLAEAKAMEEIKEQEIKSLGKNATQRIESVNKWIDANMDAETAEGLRNLINRAAGLKAVEQLIAKARNAPMAPDQAAPAPSVTAEEVRAMQFATDDAGNRKINTDPAFRREYERKRDLVYGTEEARRMVG